MKKTIALLFVFIFCFNTILPVNAISVTTNSSGELSYTYYDNGNVESVYIGNNPYSNYSYTDNNLVSSIRFSNDQSIAYDYDTHDRISRVYYDDDECAISYEYSNYGEVGVEYDYISDRKTLTQNNEHYIVNNLENGEELFKIERTEENSFDFNIASDIISRNTLVDTRDQIQLEYEINNDNCVIENSYDSLGRVTKTQVRYGEFSITSDFKYVDDTGDYIQSQETYVSGESVKYTHLWEYEYDDNGNICRRTLKENDVLIENHNFNYDGDQELISIEENEKLHTKLDYDDSGNITKITKYDEDMKINADVYKYSDKSWGDKLTKINKLKINYDSIGNPVSYNGNAYQWTAGRKLKSLNTADNIDISYSYDELGHRTKKLIE